LLRLSLSFAAFIDLLKREHGPHDNPQVLIMFAATISNASTSKIEAQGDDLPALLETVEAAVRKTHSKEKLRHVATHWQAADALARVVAVDSNEDAAASASLAGRLLDVKDVAGEMLRYLLQPEWWEHNQADHMHQSVVPVAVGTGGRTDTVYSKAEVRARHRATLSSSLWLECIGICAQVSRGALVWAAGVAFRPTRLSSVRFKAVNARAHSPLPTFRFWVIRCGHTWSTRCISWPYTLVRP
jgi:hypothetical protein